MDQKVDQKSEKEEGGDFPEIPDWQTEAADVQAGLRSVAREGIQNVWDRRMSPDWTFYKLCPKIAKYSSFQLL